MMKTTRMGMVIALLIVGCATGCAVEPDGDPVGNESDLITTGPETALPTEAKRTASAVLGVSALLSANPEDPSAIALATFAKEALTGVAVVEGPDASRKYFFDGIILEQGDIARGSIHLVVTEARRPIGLGVESTYTAELTKESAPEDAQKVEGTGLSLTRAMLALAHELAVRADSANSKQLKSFLEANVTLTYAASAPAVNHGSVYKLHGVTLMGGDIATGRVEMTIEETVDAHSLGFGNPPTYSVATKRER